MPTPPAEPEVRDVDRELAEKLTLLVIDELSKAAPDMTAAITAYLAAERAEANELAAVSSRRLAGLEEYRQKSLDLQSQLAETEAKLREAEGRLALLDDTTWKVVAQLKHALKQVAPQPTNAEPFSRSW